MREKSRAHVFIKGRVQGVFFRKNTKQKAEELEIKGWVWNLPDGRVEAVFEGDKAKVRELIGWIRKGTFLARVKRVDVQWEKPKNEFESFEIKY